MGRIPMDVIIANHPTLGIVVYITRLPVMWRSGQSKEEAVAEFKKAYSAEPFEYIYIDETGV